MSDLTCADVRLELDGLVLGDLDSETQLRVLEHTASCAACRAERARIERVIGRLEEHPPALESAPAGLAERVLAQAGTRAPKRRRPVRPRVRSRPPAPTLLLLAASLLVALGLGAWWRSGDEGKEVAGGTPRTKLQPELAPSGSPEATPERSPEPQPSREPSPRVTPEAQPTPQPVASPSPEVSPPPASPPPASPPPASPPPASPPPEPKPQPSPTPEVRPTPVESPAPEGTQEAALVARVEAGHEHLKGPQAEPGALVRAGALLEVRRGGVRLALEGGGVLLLAAKSQVRLSERGLDLQRGEALLDLRRSERECAIALSTWTGSVSSGGRCVLSVRSKRGRLEVMNGSARLGEHLVPAGKALKITPRRAQLGTWKVAEPKWARRLRPKETYLLDLAEDLRTNPALWEKGRVERARGRALLVLGPDGGKHGVSTLRRFKAKVGPRVELEIELEVDEPVQVQVNLKNDTQNDNGIWKFDVAPGGVRSFRRPLGRFKAADKSPTAFDEGDVAEKITLFAGQPGETPRIVLHRVRLVVLSER